MKIDVINGDLIIYLYNNINNNIFRDEISIEKFLKKLFIKLYDFYNIKIEGYYDVNIFLDNYYGVILKLKKEDIDYYYYYCKEVDMKINIKYSHFLYLVDNCDFDKDVFDIIIFLNHIYLLPKYKLDNKEIANLMEFSKIVYDTDEIINNGIRIN